MKRREKTISNPLTVCVECSNFQISCWLVWNTIKDLLKKKKILKFLRQNYVNGTDLKEEQVTVSLRKLSNSTRRSFNNLWKFKFLSIFSLWNALELVSMVNGTMSIVFVASVRFHKPRQRHCSAITHCTTVLIIPSVLHDSSREKTIKMLVSWWKWKVVIWKISDVSFPRWKIRFETLKLLEDDSRVFNLGAAHVLWRSRWNSSIVAMLVENPRNQTKENFLLSR